VAHERCCVFLVPHCQLSKGGANLEGFVHQPYHPRVNPFTRSEDESVSRVLCVRVLAPTEGLSGAALVGRVLQRLPRWLWLLELLHCDWIWLRIHELWLLEAWAKLVWHCGGNTHHGFLFLNFSNVLLGFWAPFGAMTSSVILAVEVWIS
jgi:hypothetical protein